MFSETPFQRRALMQRIGRKNTLPELALRRLLRKLGVGYRLHADDLPGRPDVVFRTRKKAIFVHGCFWHGHPACPKSTPTKTNTGYWRSKIERNRRRDAAAIKALNALGWRTLTIWECQLKKPAAVSMKLEGFLGMLPTARMRSARAA
jgi:DNA mismatch endonuclease (patch repair protein)